MFLARIKFLAIHKLTSGPRVIRTRQKPQADTHFVSIIQHLKHWDSVYNLFSCEEAALEVQMSLCLSVCQSVRLQVEIFTPQYSNVHVHTVQKIVTCTKCTHVQSSKNRFLAVM